MTKASKILLSTLAIAIVVVVISVIIFCVKFSNRNHNAIVSNSLTENSTSNNKYNQNNQDNQNLKITDYATCKNDEDGVPVYTFHVNNISQSNYAIQLYENDLYKVVFMGFATKIEPYEQFYDKTEYEPKQCLKFAIINKQSNTDYRMTADWDYGLRSLWVDSIQYYWYLVRTSYTNVYMKEKNDVSFMYISNSGSDIYEKYNPKWETLEGSINLYASGTWKDHSDSNDYVTDAFRFRILVGASKGEKYEYKPIKNDKLIYEDENQKLYLIGHQMYKDEDSNANYYILRFWHTGTGEIKIDDIYVDGEDVVDPGEAGNQSKMIYEGQMLGDVLLNEASLERTYINQVINITDQSEICIKVHTLEENSKNSRDGEITFKVNPKILKTPLENSSVYSNHRSLEVEHPIDN